MNWKVDPDIKCHHCGGELEVAVYPMDDQLDMFDNREIEYMWRCTNKKCPMVAWSGGKPRKAKANAKGSDHP